ncbi:MAG: tetratricopeptide repeat protein, partial [Planctomycetota bacterium]
AESVRRQLLGETLKYYQQLAAEADSDPSLRQTLAVTHGKIGTLQGELGDTKSAVDSLTLSERIFSELVALSNIHGRNPMDETDIRLLWSISQNNLAQALHQAGRMEDAATHFARAIQTQDQLFQESDDALVSDQLATTLNNLGLLLEETGAIEASEKRFLRAVALLKATDERLAQEESVTPQSETAAISSARRQLLGSVLGNLSGLLADSDPHVAIGYAKRALASQTEELQSNPGSAELATSIVVTLNALGKSQSEVGQSQAAAKSLSRAIEIGQQLLARWPDKLTYRRDLVISFNQLGLTRLQFKQYQPARTAFEEALAHQRELAQLCASDAETQSMMGGVLNNLGFLHQRLGNITGAQRAFDEAIEYQSKATELAPEVDRYKEYLGKHRHNLAASKEST